MRKLPKGPLKVIHVNRRAIGENETRVRSTLGGMPRRLVPPITISTALGKTEAFSVRIKGETRLRYDITRFPLKTDYGTADVRCWIETNDAIDYADTPDEMADPTEDTAPEAEQKD